MLWAVFCAGVLFLFAFGDLCMRKRKRFQNFEAFEGILFFVFYFEAFGKRVLDILLYDVQNIKGLV